MLTAKSLIALCQRRKTTYDNIGLIDGETLKERQGNLLKTLAEARPRESAGADTAARFDYQKNWAFCEMLDRHLADDDYLVAFEFHEDVLFLKPEKAPSHIDFCQVKTVESHRTKTLSSLTSAGRKRSTLAKLMDNASIADGGASVGIILVCNGKYDFSAESICAADLEEKFKARLIKNLQKEIPQFSESYLPRLHFYVTDVPVQGIQTFLQGKVLELFKQRFGEAFEVNIFSWMRLIQGEISRRNNYPSDQIDSVAALVRRKCIGRTEISDSLDHALAQHRKAIDMTTIATILAAEGWVGTPILRLNKALPQALSDYQDPSNDECVSLCRAISAHLDTLDLQNAALSTVLTETQAALAGANIIPPPYRDIAMTHALILLVHNEKLQF